MELAVPVTFGRFQAVAEVQQLVLHGATGHVVDGDAQVTDQSFKFESVDQYRFDSRAVLASGERLFDAVERITVRQV